ncbi:MULTISPECIES: ligand-binding sensor domain-containing protein [unclassified Paraflavitalea]|jgi:signal transduction histidine kinase/ligand-binding sensor domain-containing protein|uniref:ligand-binding sensor domain-containing protein n=1 Tax=unclassified Paraflavitalea TaxID=2798305 RepID=UPI003D3576F5
MGLKKFISIAIGLSCVFLLQAQEYKADRYTIETGMPSNYVEQVISDSTGFLWVATKKGIRRYDGYQFIQKNHPGKNIVSIAGNATGLFYTSNNDGLFYYSYSRNQSLVIAPTHFEDSNALNDHFSNLFSDTDGWVWCTDFSNIKRINLATKEMQQFALNGIFNTTDRIASFTEPRKGCVWIASINGLYVWEKELKAIRKRNETVFSQPFTAIESIGKDSIALAGFSWVYVVKASTFEILRKIPLEPGATVQKIASIQSPTRKSLVFATRGSVLEYDFVSIKKIFSLDRFSGVINHLHVQSNALLWISTSQGLIKLTPSQSAIKTYFLPSAYSFDENQIVQVAPVDNRGNYFVLGTAGKPIITDLLTSWATVPVPTAVHFVLNDIDRILFATDKGVYKYDPVHNKLVHFPKSSSFSIKKLVRKGMTIWALLKSNRVVVLNDIDFSEHTNRIIYDDVFSVANVWNDIQVDDQNQVFLAGWISTNYGIAKYDSTTKRFEKVASKTPSERTLIGDYYNRICVSKNFHLLVSGYGGFNSFDENGIAHKKISIDSYPFPNEHVEGIQELQNGEVWMGTEEGIVVWNPRSDQVQQVSTQNGLYSNYAVHGFDLLPTGEIAVGFNNALSLIAPDKVFNTSLNEKLVLSALYMNGSLVEEKTIVEVSPENRNLTFHFSALNFADERKLNYQYRIDQGNWQSLGHVPIWSFSNFKPGRYIVEVRVSDNTDRWQLKQLSFEIIAYPRFVETLWFPIVLFAIVGLILVSILMWRIRELKQLNNLRQEISQELHDEMGATLSSAKIMNDIVLKDMEISAKSRTYLSRLAKEITQLQYQLEEIIWSLKPGNQNLREAIEKAIQFGTSVFDAKDIHFNHNIQFDEVQQPVSFEVKRKLYLFLKEAMNNIAKHSKANSVLLNVELRNGQVKIEIKDNGVGFSVSEVSARNGIDGMRKTAEKLKAELRIESMPNKGTFISLETKI